MNKYTSVVKEGNKYVLKLNIGVQSFRIDTMATKKKDVLWFEKQLKKALETLVNDAYDAAIHRP